jgi:hypothetical protein
VHGQNRAYAVSQLTDLHAKLSKAQAAVQQTRASAPALRDTEPKEKEKAGAAPAPASAPSGSSKSERKEKDEKKREENQLAKSVRDRCACCAISHAITPPPPQLARHAVPVLSPSISLSSGTPTALPIELCSFFCAFSALLPSVLIPLRRTCLDAPRS